MEGSSQQEDIISMEDESSSLQQPSHNHDINEVQEDNLEGYLHKNRSKYCRKCKRSSVSNNAQHKNFDLDSCFLPENISQEEGEEKGYQRNQEDYYFDSYSHFNIHEDMLKDRIRTRAYMKSITNNRHLFQGKVVLDIGCGTGILSIFAAKAGAKHVYAVDNANIVQHAKIIVAQNNLADKITLIQGKMEEVELPVEKVDIIISEWMGYFLLYESMLDCVLDARDKYLAKDGLIFPDKAAMYISSFCNDDVYNQRFDFWNEVYGFDMSCIKEWVFKEPLIDQMDRGTVNGDIVKLIEFDLYKTQKSDLDFVADYSFKIRRKDYVQGVAIWWDTYFSHCKVPLKISTGPFAGETHWKQTMFFIENEDIPVVKGDTMTGKVAVKKSTKNPRDLDIKIQFKLENEEIYFDRTQFYKMN